MKKAEPRYQGGVGGHMGGGGGSYGGSSKPYGQGFGPAGQLMLPSCDWCSASRLHRVGLTTALMVLRGILV